MVKPHYPWFCLLGMHAEPVFTGLIWFHLTWTASVKHATCLVENSIVAYWCCLSKLHTDAMHQIQTPEHCFSWTLPGILFRISVNQFNTANMGRDEHDRLNHWTKCLCPVWTSVIAHYRDLYINGTKGLFTRCDCDCDFFSQLIGYMCFCAIFRIASCEH